MSEFVITVTYGTWRERQVYARVAARENAEKLLALARSLGYHDAELREINYEANISQAGSAQPGRSTNSEGTD